MFEKVKIKSYETYVGPNGEKNLSDVTIYRPLQTGIETIWPFMTKRKVKVTLEEFLYLAYNQSIPFADLDQSRPNIHKIMTEINIGCFAI